MLGGCKHEKKWLEVSNVVKEVMRTDGITNCHISSLCDYKNVHYYLTIPQFTEDEFELYFSEETKAYGVLTDELVKAEFEFDSVEKLRQNYRDNYLEHLKILKILSARDEIINYLIDNSHITLDEEEVAVFARGVVHDYENEALLYGYVDLDQYVQEVLNLSESEFMEECVKEAKKGIKKLLVLGAVAYKEKIEIDQQDDIYTSFQMLENKIYEIFIDTEEGF